MWGMGWWAGGGGTGVGCGPGTAFDDSLMLGAGDLNVTENTPLIIAAGLPSSLPPRVPRMYQKARAGTYASPTSPALISVWKGSTRNWNRGTPLALAVVTALRTAKSTASQTSVSLLMEPSLDEPRGSTTAVGLPSLSSSKKSW